jgi:hypothetical protein
MADFWLCEHCHTSNMWRERRCHGCHQPRADGALAVGDARVRVEKAVADPRGPDTSPASPKAPVEQAPQVATGIPLQAARRESGEHAGGPHAQRPRYGTFAAAGVIGLLVLAGGAVALSFVASSPNPAVGLASASASRTNIPTLALPQTSAQTPGVTSPATPLASQKAPKFKLVSTGVLPGDSIVGSLPYAVFENVGTAPGFVLEETEYVDPNTFVILMKAIGSYSAYDKAGFVLANGTFKSAYPHVVDAGKKVLLVSEFGVSTSAGVRLEITAQPPFQPLQETIRYVLSDIVYRNGVLTAIVENRSTSYEGLAALYYIGYNKNGKPVEAGVGSAPILKAGQRARLKDDICSYGCAARYEFVVTGDWFGPSPNT